MLSTSMGWDCVFELQLLTGMLFIIQVIYEYEPGGMILAGETEEKKKMCTGATLSTTDPTRTNPGANQCLRNERPVTNRISHDTANHNVSYTNKFFENV
jgi:hypothetical protein